MTARRFAFPASVNPYSLLVAALAALLLMLASATSAVAAVECADPGASLGVPSISVSKEQPAEALYSTPITIRLTADQPAAPPGAPESGFNLSFRDVLPPGTSYKAGSSPVTPTVINNQPAPGYTTLIFSNVSDLAPGASFSLSYQLEYSPLTFDAGDTITTGDVAPPAAAAAYVNCAPRWVPLFDAAGKPVEPGPPNEGHSFTSSAATGPKTTKLTAIEIEKSEPSPESELLRGLHNDQTAYTITVRNNTENPTDNVGVVDYLPAGLEFLGCGTVDNTTDAASNPGSTEEYPGSGAINPGNAPSLGHPCVTPTSVEFGNFDPDGSGPAPSGLYTRVEWDLGPAGDLAANGEYQMSYVAAIPICPNTTTWTGATPTATSLGQTANLDNNSCAGGETVDETALTNFATATGDYQPSGGGSVSVSDTDDHTVTAEDLAIWKEATSEDYAVGQTTRWLLHVRSSEYRTFANLNIADTVPDGMCPVVGVSPPTSPSSDPECAPTGNSADNPTTNWSSATEYTDGSWSVGWSLGSFAADTDTVIEFSTLTRQYYQENGADADRVLATDPLTNNVTISGEGYPICTDGTAVADCSDPGTNYIPHTEAPGNPIADESHATVESGLPTLNKTVASAASTGDPVDCSTGAFSAGPEAGYRPGDIVCWKVRVNFPGTVATGGVTISDFLPAGTSYVTGVPGTGPTIASNVNLVGGAPVDHGSYLDFNLDVPGQTVDDSGIVFEYIIATRITNAVPDPSVDLPPLRGNLLKMSTVNSAGEVTTYRDAVAAEVGEPALAVTKGVKRINGVPFLGNPANTDGGVIAPGAPVQYRIDVSNSGPVEAVDTQVSERLVGPYDCSMISLVSTPGSSSYTCATSGSGATAVTVITWNGVTVPASDGVNDGRVELNFSVTYPNTIAPGVRIDDRACVDWYENETNDPLNPRYNWAVANDPADCGTPTLPGTPIETTDGAINDTSYVNAPGSIAKTATTSVSETNNNAASQATIGEEITYRVTATIPDQTTVNDFSIVDLVSNPDLQVYVTNSVGCETSLPALCTAATVGFGTPANTATLTMPDYTNTTGSAQTITLVFTVKVADDAGNTAGATLTNRGTVNYTDQYGTSQSPQTNQTTVTVVEPNPQVTKSEDDSDNIVSAGQEVQYALTVTNPARTSPTRPASPSHETVVTDIVPVGVTPTDGSGTPIADGGTVVLCDGSSAGAPAGTWSAGTRTITWNVGDVAPGSSTTLRYCTEIDTAPPPTAGQPLTNNAAISGTSMPGVVPGERSYNDTADATLTVAGSTLSKSANPTNAPVGKHVQYTVTVTLPALTTFNQYKVEDALPAGTSFVSFDAVGCAGSCGGVPTATTSQSGQDLTWDFGTIPSDAAIRTLTITYTAVVDDVVGNQQGTTLTNSATNSWCTVTTDPCPGGNQIEPPPATAPVTVTEPNLSIDKDVNCQTGDTDQCDIQPGDSFTYSITVSNSGSGTAYDAIFQDQIPTNLTNVQVQSPLPAGVTAVTPDAPNTHAWRIDSIAPSGSVTITYTAELVASTSLSDPFTVTNTATVTEYWGLDDAERGSNPDAREYPEGADPSDTVTLDGHLPEPQVVKTVANSGNAEIDQCLTWTLTISNGSDDADLNDIMVVDTLPAGWTFCAGSGSPSDPDDITGQALTWNNVGDIAGGGSDIVVTFGAKPTMAALDVNGEPTNPYTNNVTVTGDDASGASASADGDYEATDSEDANIQMPNLTIAKTPDSATVHAGAWSDWTIVVTNTGPGTARNVVVRDAVPSTLLYNVALHPATVVCSPLPCDNATGPWNYPGGMLVNSGAGPSNAYWTLDSMPAGSTFTLTLPMFIPASTATNTSFTNYAYVSSTERPTEINDSGNWTSDRSADMQIVKSDGGATGTAGQNVTYTLTATNNGPSSANNATVVDNIDTSQFEFVSITPGNGADTCSTTGSPVVTSVSCDIDGVLLPAASRTFTLVLKIKSGVTATVSNTATTSADEPDPTPGNNSSTDTTPIGVQTSLTIVKDVKSGSPSTIPNHGQTTFTVTVSNGGPSDAVNVPITDTLPAGLSCVSVTVYTPTGCDGDPGDTVTLTIPSIVAGGSQSFEMTVRGEVVGSQINTATIDGGDSDTATVVVDPMADLEITKDAPEEIPSGFDFDYELTVHNNGPDPAVTPTVTDNLPNGLIYTGFTADAGVSCSASGQLVTCTLPTIASGDDVDITLFVNSGFALSETCIDNTGAVSSTTADSANSNNSDQVNTCVGPNADVAITKTGPAFGADGWPLGYTLSVVNNGPATAENVVVSDPLPAGLTYQSSSTNVGTCSESLGTVTCSLGDMSVGATAQITIVAVPDASVVGTTVHNVATVITDTPEGNTTNNVDDADTPIENNAYPTSSDVTISKTISNPAPKVGDEVSYSMVATNKGPDIARSVVLTDTLPGGLIYVSASGDGTCSFAAPVLTCQLGDIPTGQSRTITLKAVIAHTGSIVNLVVVNAANDRYPADNSATAPATAAKSTARIKVTKKASKRTVKVGRKASYRIKVKNVSKVTAVNVEVCDLIPSRLSVVRKNGGKLKSGNLCWSIPVLKPGSSRTFKPVFRVNNGRSTHVTNPVRARAYNAKTVRAKAKIRVPRKAARGGGTTG